MGKTMNSYRRRNAERTGGLLFLAALVLSGTSAKTADTSNTGARFALHAKPHFFPSKQTPTLCDYSPNNDGVSCEQYTVVQPIKAFPGPHVYLVLGQGSTADGVVAFSCGIDYSGSSGQGIDPAFVTFTGCNLSDPCLSSLEHPCTGNWPAPGSGMRFRWASCPTQEVGGLGVHVVARAFYIYAYSEDVLEVTPNDLGFGTELAISDCSLTTINFLDFTDPTLVPALLGRVHFGGDGSEGYTPCSPVPTRPTTWGRLKSMYPDEDSR